MIEEGSDEWFGFEEKSFGEPGTEGCANFLTGDGAWTGAAHREYDAEHVEPVVECFPAMLVGWAARSGRRATAGATSSRGALPPRTKKRAGMLTVLPRGEVRKTARRMGNRTFGSPDGLPTSRETRSTICCPDRPRGSSPREASSTADASAASIGTGLQHVPISSPTRGKNARRDAHSPPTPRTIGRIGRARAWLSIARA